MYTHTNPIQDYVEPVNINYFRPKMYFLKGPLKSTRFVRIYILNWRKFLLYLCINGNIFRIRERISISLGSNVCHKWKGIRWNIFHIMCSVCIKPYKIFPLSCSIGPTHCQPVWRFSLQHLMKLLFIRAWKRYLRILERNKDFFLFSNKSWILHWNSKLSFKRELCE